MVFNPLSQSYWSIYGGFEAKMVDLNSGIVTVRKAKFGKSRFIPLHDSTRLALARYAEIRDAILPQRPVKAFFVTARGTRVRYALAEWTFAKVSCAIGLRTPAPERVNDFETTGGLSLRSVILDAA